MKRSFALYLSSDFNEQQGSNLLKQMHPEYVICKISDPPQIVLYIMCYNVHFYMDETELTD